jgi:Peptidase A4 family
VNYLLVKPVAWWAATLCLLAYVVSTHGLPSFTAGPRTIAQPIPVPAATTNDYWAGYVMTGSAPYHGVHASWTVPATRCSGNRGSSTAYVWIGEGGYVRGMMSSLIQAGTASDCLNGVPRYHAFYEWYPGIYATDFPVQVQVGDRVTLRVDQPQPGYWTLALYDETSGARSETATVYNADTDSADFIVERPTLCTGWSCNQIPLGRFDSVTFRDAAIGAASGDLRPNPGAAGVESIALTNPDSQRTLAVPGRVRTQSGDLSVIWQQSQ